jgi:zinc and cadmium transporter
MEAFVHGTLFASLIAVLAVQVLASVGVVSLHQLEVALRRALPYLISLAVGVLLATALVHLLPESIEQLGTRPALWMVLLGTVLGLYAFERIFHLLSGVSAEPDATHQHSEHCDHGHAHHHHASRPATLLLGCITHSLVDGTSVAAAFSVSRSVGWVTALAVGLHEVPHRLGDFALLVHMGVRRTRAAMLSIAAGASSLLGWALVVALGEGNAHSVAWLLPISAGSFLYIALVDLLPELRNEEHTGRALSQIAALAAGVLLAIVLTKLPHA